MNFEDEDYVRYYTRETVSWLAMEWEGQAVLALMLHGKFDRSGVFDCDGHLPSQAVTLVTKLPLAVTEVGLERLLKLGTWVFRDGKLVWPNYVRGQNCRRSDRRRKQESRHNRLDLALGNAVTADDQMSPRVTSGHLASPSVTPSLAKPSLDPPKPPEGAAQGTKRKRKPHIEAPQVSIPIDFAPTVSHRAYAAMHGLDLDLELTAFIGWAQGRTQISWNGAFTTRLANAVKFARERKAQPASGTFRAAAPVGLPSDPDGNEARKLSADAALRRAEAERDKRLAKARADLGGGTSLSEEPDAVYGHPRASAGHT